jgi:hypothetical protein
VENGVRERVVENWLINTDERALEVPFCQLLLGEGYRVIHLSRHGESEQGKDVLAIDPDGQPCAFQLKDAGGGKITQRNWETFKPQIERLVELPIKHPAIPEGAAHRAFLVTNGELDEPVRIEILDRNRAWAARGYPKLETVVKGDLLTRFQALQTDFWPVELGDVKTLLELFLADGEDCIGKARLADFLCMTLPFEREEVSRAECSRAIASAAVFTSYALHAHQLRGNHVAEIEGWVIYAAHLLGLAEQRDLDDQYWRGALDVAEFAIAQALLNLCEELQGRPDLIEGNALLDGEFYRPRVTWLCGLLAAFGLWRLSTGQHDETDDFLKEFVLIHRDKLSLWGEGALPQFLAVTWYLRHAVATAEPDSLLAGLISGITQASLKAGRRGVPDPYYDIEEGIAINLGLNESERQYSFAGRSYGLETLVQLFARRNWRRRMRWLWPDVTRLDYFTFVPQGPWRFYLWRSKQGELKIRQPNKPQSWSELREISAQVDEDAVPRLLRERPWLLLLFLIVYPHRLSPEPAKLLDAHFAGV